MFRYIRQRLFFAIIALFLIALFVYLLIVHKSDVRVDADIEKQLLEAKKSMSPEGIAQFTKELKLKYGLISETGYQYTYIERFFIYIGNFFRGDFGFFDDGLKTTEIQTIPQLFFKPLRATILITFPSFLMSTILGIIIGVFAGYKRGKLFDTSSNIFVIIFQGIPSFVLAPFVITVALRFGIPPTVINISADQPFSVIFSSYLPPIFVLTITSLSGYVVFVRNMVVTVLTSNYVLIAKTKGLSQTQIFFKYVLRNAFVPIAGGLITSFVGLLTGSIIIERFWGVNGTANVIANSFPTGQINIVMFSTIFFTALSLILEIFSDIFMSVMDPRIVIATRSKRNYWQFFLAWRERNKLKKEYLLAHPELTNKFRREMNLNGN